MNGRPLARGSVLLFCIAFLAATGSCFATFDDGLRDPALFTRTYPTVDMSESSVVELSRTERIDYLGGVGRVEFKIHRVFRVLGEAGVGLADFRFLTPEGAKVAFHARTILETGEVHETTDANTFEDEQTINGEKFHYFATRIPGVSEDCIVELNYTITTDGLRYILLDSIAGFAPLLRYDLEIFASSGIAFEIRTYNTPAQFTLARDGTGFLAKLHVENVNASKAEDFSPPSTTYDPWWLFALRQVGPLSPNLARWETALQFVGDHLYNDSRDLIPASVDVDVDGCADDRCRVARALAYVHQETSFSGFSSVFESRPLRSVMKSKSANATERAMLLHAALDDVGIDAYFAPTTRTMSRGIDPTFPAYQWFNHLVVVAEVAGQRLVIDPSCTICGLDELPHWSRHAFAVEMRPVRRLTGDFAIEATPIEMQGKKPGSTSARDITTLTLSLAATGALSGTVDRVRTGDAAIENSDVVQRSNAKKNARRVESWAEDFLTCREVTDVVGDRCEGATCSRRATIACDSSVLVTRDRLIVPLQVLRAHHEDLFTQAVRTRDLHVPYEAEEVDRLVLTPPKGFVVDELPPDETVKSKSFVASIASTVGADGVVVVTRTLRSVPGVVSKSDYPNAQTVLRRYGDWRQHLLTFRRATPTPAAGLGIGFIPKAPPPATPPPTDPAE